LLQVEERALDASNGAVVKVETTTTAPADTGADTIAVALFEDENPDAEIAGGAVAALVASGEAKPGFRTLTHTHAGGRRWIVVGLGRRDELDGERARIAGAVVLNRAKSVGSRSLCWSVPDGVPAGALAEGTLLAAYSFDRFKSSSPDGDEGGGVERLVLSGPGVDAASVASSVIVAEAANAARDLQNAPANDLTPARLGEIAEGLGAEIDGLAVMVEGPDALRERGMGAFAAVAQGSAQEPRLITLRYTGPGARGRVLGLVGKAVTFDTGGISIKPAGKMHEMKFDMSGGAAVLEAVAAIARLELPVDVVGVIGATENMPSDRAVKPGDIVTAMNGTTIEVNNTDAEGRLVLADCLCWAREQGAERLVDIATLTGAIVVALGSTYAGLFGDDDAWCELLAAAGGATGERLWRMPLDREYADLIKGRYADIVNATAVRKASSSTAAEFLKRFAADLPWAHVDMAGVMADLGRPYASKAGSGFGVRLLVEVARRASDV
jgi:leucyl aminopeptidase